MLRHTREQIRYQRERYIRKRKNQWIYKFWKDQGWATTLEDGRTVYSDTLPDNWLVKNKLLCSCSTCKNEKYRDNPKPRDKRILLGLD